MKYFKNMKKLNKKKKTFDAITDIQMERSPTRWKTMYRDQYRKFSGSPQRGEGVEGEDDTVDQFDMHHIPDDNQLNSYPTS